MLSNLVFRALALAAVVLLSVPVAQAGRGHHAHRHGVCGPACADCAGPAHEAPCQPQVVTRTIMVPHTDYKTMTVSEVVCKPVVRQRTVSITRMVPETTMVVRSFPVTNMEPRTRTETYSVCRMEYETVNDTIEVPVPHTEMRQGVRTVCRPVMTTEMRSVCVDAGHYESGCTTDCDGCVRACRVWVPGVQYKEVPVTVCRPEMVEVPYSYPVTVCRYEERTISRQIARPTYETKTREVAYTVPVTNFVEREVPHTVYRPLIEDRVVNYTEMVPETVERTVTVPVCTLVPQQVTHTIGGCGSCPACGY